MNTIAIHKKFPADLRNTIKDCLCNLFFRKKDLLSYFKSLNCTSNDLRGASNDLTKSDNVDIVLNNLEEREDGGLLQKRNLIDSLMNWSDYGSYWFKKGSLDPIQAKQSIENLKKILGKKTEQEEKLEEIKKREEQVKANEKKRIKLEELNNVFKKLCGMEEHSQKRGYELENLLVELFQYFEIEVEGPFKLNGEQIDGSFNFEGNNFIFEAKWQDSLSANNDLYTFAYKIESNTLYPRGFFLSINGFSTDAVERITHNKKPQLILLDASDLIVVLDGRISLKDLLKRKVKFAQTRGKIYMNAHKLLNE